jgi:threonine dehydratase
MHLSWRARRTVSTAPPQTIAQGLAVQSPHAEAVADLVDLVDDILLVDDEALIAAVRLAHRQLGLVLEPSGAAERRQAVDKGDSQRGSGGEGSFRRCRHRTCPMCPISPGFPRRPAVD